MVSQTLACYTLTGGSLSSTDPDPTTTAADLVVHSDIQEDARTNQFALTTAENLGPTFGDEPAMEITITAETGHVFNLSNLSFDWGTYVREPETNTVEVLTSVNAYTAPVFSQTFYPDFGGIITNISVDLSSPDFTGLETITLRVHHHVTSSDGRDGMAIFSSQSTGVLLRQDISQHTFQDIILTGIDADENRYGFNILDPTDAALDSDGDRMSNVDELFADTDPSDQQSVFIMTQGPEGAGSFQWTSTSGRLYQVEYSDDLLFWQTLPGASAVVATSTWSHISDENAPEHRFYRVIVFPK
jgi:hypothetical protein